MYIRKQNFQGSGSESLFLWGARQTGKSTLLQYLFPGAPYFDFLKGDVFERFSRNPSLIREMFESNALTEPIILDEIQRIPALLNEIHWLITNRNLTFIMSGSSPRNILRNRGNLLGGRAQVSRSPRSQSCCDDGDL